MTSSAYQLEIRFVEVSNFLTDIGSAIYKINMPTGYKQNFVLCAEIQGLLPAIVLRNLDHIDVCV